MAFGAKGNKGGLSALRSDDDEGLPEPIPGAEAPAEKSDGTARVEAIIDRVIYKNDAGDFAIYAATQKNGTPREFSLLISGGQNFYSHDKLDAEGVWGERNGRPQFKAVSAQQHEIKGGDGIVAWLSTGTVPGVGAMTAKKLLDHFGDRLEEVMGDAEELATAGILPSRAENIATRWGEASANARLYSFLMSIGFGQKTVGKIIRKLGNAAEAIVRSNPWSLADVVPGIGFHMADAAARNLGFETESPDRIAAGFKFMLEKESYQRGSVAVKESVAIREAAAVLELPRRLIMDQIDAIIERHGAIKEADCFYLPRLHAAETELANSIAQRMQLHANENFGPLPVEKALQLIEEEEAKLPFKLDPSQRDACIMALTSPVSIITGGPGTGKSTIQKLIAAVLRKANRDVQGAAPTAIAAKRQTEASGIPSATIHRRIGLQKGGEVLFNKSNPLDINWLIVDELSMSDLSLTKNLHSALAEDACITFVGDVDQLPSIGPGQVLYDLIESEMIPVARLTQPHRQLNGDGGGIITAAHMINRGELPVLSEDEAHGFHFIELSDEHQMLETVKTLLKEVLPARGYDLKTDVQVLVSMRKGVVGMTALNQELREIFNPESLENEIVMGNHKFLPGDRVMHLQNDYERGVCNGDVGSIRGVVAGEKKGSQNMIVDFDDNEVAYTQVQLNDLELAFTGTVHKAQGSEHKVVIILAPREHANMITRSQIYTGVTRAKNECFLIADPDTLYRGLQRVVNGARSTTLIERLKNPGQELKLEPKTVGAIPSFGF